MPTIQTRISVEEEEIFNQYKGERSIAEALRDLIYTTRFNQEIKEIKEVPIKSEFEKLIDIIKD
tara:strand:+ start:96 stop:287 length:192 start_codon:yes stop_codon:yes gene_type:complete